MVGNFPQAFSHLALVQAAFDLADADARSHPHRHPHQLNDASRSADPSLVDAVRGRPVVC